MKIKLTLLIILITALNMSSKANTDFDKLKKEIVNNLKWFNDSLIYSDYEEAGIDIDSLASSTELKLRKLLTYKESITLNLKEFPNLKLEAQTNDSLNIRFYFFSNTVGSNGYEDVHTVCQWQNSTGKLFSYIISKKLPGTIGKIYRLKSNSTKLYLILSNNYYNTIAHVISFKEDYLILDYPAFVNESKIILKQADVSFNPQKQKLTISLYEDNDGMEAVIEPMVHRPEESPSYKKILPHFEGKESVSFIFNGKKFIE